MTLLLLKITLAPALVVGSSLAGRRWGATVSGALVALPVVVGPILLFVAIEQGSAYVSAAASASLLGLVGLTGFVVVYAIVAQTRDWLAAVTAGMAASLAIDLLLSRVSVDPVLGFILALGAFWAARVFLSRFPGDAHTDAPRWRWDLPARAAATAALVLTLTTAAELLGPKVTGALAPLPIALSVMVAFTHALAGAGSARKVLAGFLTGANGFATFCFLVAILSPIAGIAITFTLALAAAAVVQIISIALTRPMGFGRKLGTRPAR